MQNDFDEIPLGAHSYGLTGAEIVGSNDIAIDNEVVIGIETVDYDEIDISREFGVENEFSVGKGFVVGNETVSANIIVVNNGIGDHTYARGNENPPVSTDNSNDWSNVLFKDVNFGVPNNNGMELNITSNAAPNSTNSQVILIFKI